MGYGVNGAGKDAVWVLKTSLRSPLVPEGKGALGLQTPQTYIGVKRLNCPFTTKYLRVNASFGVNCQRLFQR